MADIEKLGLSELSRLLRGKQLSASELLDLYLDNIRKKEDTVGAFITLCEESARTAAKLCDVRLKEGEDLPLLGIPFAVKDNFCTEGVLTSCGSNFLENYIPPYTATAVKKLTDAGAILVGKTNMDEFGMGSLTENSAFKTTRNPLDPTRSAGGSSGGSAAAVAASFVPFALGSDTGGSVRQPAAFCGNVGIKPTYGRISRYGLVSFSSSLDTVGIISKSSFDGEQILSVISGKDPRDATSLSADAYVPSTLSPSVKGLKIGIVTELTEGCEPSVERAFRNAAESFARMGATICDISLPSLSLAAECYYIISSCEASSNLARFDGVRYGKRAENCRSTDELYVKSRSQGFGDEVKRRILLGTFALSSGYYDEYYARASALRGKMYSEISDVFSKCDLLICPTARSTAKLLGSKSFDTELYRDDILTSPANLCGIPAISLPAGKDEKGLPIGLQIMTPRLSENLLLSAAKTFEMRKEG